MSASAAALVAALLTVVVVLATAMGLLAGDASAAPYPPTEPCTLWAAAAETAGTTGTADGDVTVTVLGSGLGPTEPVRLVHTASQRTVGFARTSSDGRFRAVVSAPAGPEGQAPQISAASPEATCTTPVPPTVGTSPPGGADNGGGAGNGGTGPGGGSNSGGTGDGNGTGDGSGGGNGDGSGDGTGGGAGTSGAPGSAPTRTGDRSSSPATSGATSGTASEATPTSATTQADPPRIIDTPFTIGLVIAAILLVLGTLLVLMIARRPDHR